MSFLSESKGIPQYVRIREALRNAIEQGDYDIGTKVPSELELAEEFSVSRMTARRAVSDLVREGMLTRRPGLGTYVRDPRYIRQSTRLTSFYEDATERGLNMSSKVLLLEKVPASRRIAKAVQINPGDPVIRSLRVRSIDDKPVTIHEAFVPYHVFPELLERDDLAVKSLYSIYEENGFKISKAQDRIQAVMPDQKQMNLLNMPPNMPIIVIQRTTYTVDNLIIEFVISSQRADNYSYEVDVIR